MIVSLPTAHSLPSKRDFGTSQCNRVISVSATYKVHGADRKGSGRDAYVEDRVAGLSIRRRGGRKLVLAPDGTNVTTAPVRRHIDNAMVKAIARAFRWREMLENGTHATIAEIAAAEKINETYVGRVLRLTLLAPDIVETIPEWAAVGGDDAGGS